MILKGYSTYRKANCSISNVFKDIDNKLLEYDEMLGKPTPDILWQVPRELLTPELKEETLLKLTGSEDNPGFLGIGVSKTLTNSKQPPECTGVDVFKVNNTRNTHRRPTSSTSHHTHTNNVNEQISKLSAEGARRLTRGWATTLVAPNEKARSCTLLIQGSQKVAGKETKTRKVRPSWTFQNTDTVKLTLRPQQTIRMRAHKHTTKASPTLTLTRDNSHLTDLLTLTNALQVRSVNSIEVWLKSEDLARRMEVWKMLDKHARKTKIPRTEFLSEEGKRATESQDTIRADQFTA